MLAMIVAIEVEAIFYRYFHIQIKTEEFKKSQHLTMAIFNLHMIDVFLQNKSICHTEIHP